MSPGFGWQLSPFDARDHKMLSAMNQLEQLPRAVKTWHSDKVLNQLQTNHCVGFAYAAFGISTPIEDPWTDATGHNLYRACKVLDHDPAGEQGSTLRSGARVMRARRRIASYYFASSIDEAADYVAKYGPVVLGIPWLSAMSKPSAFRGIIVARGQQLGGHAILWYGVDGEWAVLRNSWGLGWGKRGDCRISLADLRKLYLMGGEALAASELPLAA